MKFFFIWISLSIVFVLSALNTNAQLQLEQLGWRSPVDIPILLSGNFAELRSNHFHGGIDIKTNSEEGHRIYAVQNGYITRIRVSSGGYGNAIYINHPDGHTSVYAHLKEFNIQLDRYVKAKQYDKESFSVDLYPAKGELSVEKGDIIGLSGNSGSSAGPHLHFEVRDTKTSKPMNGLFLGYDIVDTIAPKMYYLYVYPQDNASNVFGYQTKKNFAIKKQNNKYQLTNGDTLRGFGNLGFGLKVNDYLNGSSNRCGVHFIKMYINNELCFHSQFDEFSFYETRYINSLMDYEENVTIKRKLHKLFVDPNNKLSLYKKVVNRGLLSVEENMFYTVRIETVDAYGNASEIQFYVAADEPKKNSKIVDDLILASDKPFELDSLGVRLKMPANSFYTNIPFEFTVDSIKQPSLFSNTVHLNKRTIPVHKYFELSLDCYPTDSALHDKLILATKRKEKYVSVGGLYAEGKIKARLRSFGTYVVVIDTVPPIVKPYAAYRDLDCLADVDRIDFYVKDEFSGVIDIQGRVNGHWVLFQWDPKNKHLYYEFDEYMPQEGIAELELKVTDYRGNETIFRKAYEVKANEDHDIGQ